MSSKSARGIKRISIRAATLIGAAALGNGKRGGGDVACKAPLKMVSAIPLRGDGIHFAKIRFASDGIRYFCSYNAILE